MVAALKTASVVHAAGFKDRLTGGVGAVAGDLKETSPDLPVVVGEIINVALSVVGSLLLIYLIYAGFLWMTAEGESKRVDKARDILKQTIIGLVIIVAAFAISNFVIGSLANSVGPVG